MIGLIFMRDLKLAWGKGGNASGNLVFFALVMTCFTFGIGPDAAQSHAAAASWVAALLSTLIALPSLFEKDHEDGSLEQYLLFPATLEAIILAKIIAHWAASFLPLLAAAPLLLWLQGNSMEEALRLLASLLLGGPAILAISAFGAALTLGIRRGGVIQALILLPLYSPTLIFAVSAANGIGEGAWAMLGGLSLMLLPLSCFACAWLVRAAQE